MAGKPIPLTPNVQCAAHGCHSRGRRGTDRTGRPTPPVGWHEVVVPNDDGHTATVLFACSASCRLAVRAGLVRRLSPMSQHKPMPGY